MHKYWTTGTHSGGMLDVRAGILYVCIPSGAVKEVILRVTERAPKEVIARGSRIWTLLPLVIAQKKMHLRGIEPETSSLECLGATTATNQV
jgi:hypothetical protein